MKTITLTTLLLAICITTNAQYNLDNLKLTANEYSVERYTHDKLRIYPIRCNEAFTQAHRDVGNYTNLKDAIEKNKIKVSEVDESGTVNTLMAENKSQDSIYIMAGEVVKGGKQDRIIAQDVIIPPGQKVDLAAFCVEQGRWSHKGSGSKFDGYFNVSSKEVRKAAVVGKSQGGVWDKVAKTTAANNSTSATGAYTELENNMDYRKEVDRYVKNFKGAFNGDPKVVGVVAVTGDQIIGCDIFATHDLFVNAYDNLIHSYITDAMTNGGDVKIDTNKVQEYLDGFLADESKQEEEVGKDGAIFKSNGKKLHLTKF